MKTQRSFKFKISCISSKFSKKAAHMMIEHFENENKSWLESAI